MSTINRREALRSLLTGALQAAGTVVLACSAMPAALAQDQGAAEGNLQERADRLASDVNAPPDGYELTGAFRRGGFANGGGGGGGGFRRGGFANGGGGGGFRRGGGFRN